MTRLQLLSFTAAGALALAIGHVGAANAAFVVNPLVGGAPTGVNYANFDLLPLGSAGGSSGGIGVSFTGDGQTVINSASGLYAPPFISNSNGALFGDPMVAGQDTTPYLTSGIGTIALMLPGAMQYFGLLWGSVDPYNTLEFFSGATSVGSVTGSTVQAGANGDQGVNGTYYVNIVSDLMFDKVIASSTQYAFELDNVSYNPTNPNSVPEPIALGLLGIGLLGIGAIKRRRSAASSVPLSA